MKKLLTFLLIGLALVHASGAVEGESLITGDFGINYFGYETLYLTTGMIYQIEAEQGMDFVVGADFGIHTEQVDGKTEASFLIPLKLGLSFPFDGERVDYAFGVGLSPNFQFSQESSASNFLMGPYVNGTMRLRVHPVMSVFVQLQQDLLFGKPEWIYTGSRFVVGVSF
ncbi:MAG TPA: hypothetical protein ENN41_08430 [Sediminispirochaeta sp.]|nr:hypothetical protein [Sediminispirochaeta sp.]